MQQPYRWLTAILGALGVALAAGAFALLEGASKTDVNAEFGKWLLTVAAGLWITGALSVVVRQIDQRRSERETWHTVRDDLVAANQIVMLARMRLVAHQSARIYQDQLGEFMRARAELRRISALGIVVADRDLHRHIRAMRDYLDALGEEYEAGYLRVERQQRLDELWLTDQMQAANDGTLNPMLPKRLAEPTEAWRQLSDPERFPQLARLLRKDVFLIDAFRSNYKLAKRRLEELAGFEFRPLSDSVHSADKLSKRTKELMSGHPELPADVSEPMVLGLETIDRGAIDNVIDELNRVTLEAINTIYAASELEHAVTEGRQPEAPRTPSALPRKAG